MEILDEKVQLWIDSARFAKPKPAVYVLYDRKLNVLYIGHSQNLQEQFTKDLDSSFEGDECKQKCHSYQKLFIENPEQKQNELLEQYKSEHGSLPPCNEHR